MDKNPFAPEFRDLPQEIPIFPLTGVLLLPDGQLPLNIFEPRYLAMVEHALSTHRIIGMVQPKPEQEKGKASPDVYMTGCAGKITIFNEMSDGRYEIKLSGICRFDIKKELKQAKGGYRRIKPNWSAYKNDMTPSACLNLNRDRLVDLLRQYFDGQGMDCDWDAVENAPDGKLITCLSMACPFEPEEKQALLEAPCRKTRAEMFLKVLELAVRGARRSQSAH